MSRSLVFPALSALLLLGACATATPYQAATEELHGYENQKIERNRWQVSFGGNALTDRQTVETYLLYRAAELTLQQGFDGANRADRGPIVHGTKSNKCAPNEDIDEVLKIDTVSRRWSPGPLSEGKSAAMGSSTKTS